MMIKKEDYKIVAAGVVGGILGLAIGGYLLGKISEDRPLSRRLTDLAGIVEELEGINTKDAEDLKERIKNILLKIESNYVDSEK